MGKTTYAKYEISQWGEKMTDWITIGLSAYGVLLTTILLIYGIYQNIRTVKVRQSLSLIRISRANIPTALTTICVNKGKRPVQINGFGFTLPNKMVFSVVHPIIPINFPKRLADGEGFDIHINIRDMAADLQNEGYSDIIKIRGFVRDASSKRYFSKKMKFDINRWIE